MAQDPKVKVTVDTKQAQDSLNRLGASFAGASNKANQAGESAKLIGSRLSETIKSFIAFEFAKKIVQTADATMRATDSMKGLSAATRENAKSYVENTAAAKESLDQIILATSGFMSTLATYASEGLAYWSQIFGADPDANKRALTQAQQTRMNIEADLKLYASQRAALVKKMNEEKENYDKIIVQNEIDALDDANKQRKRMVVTARKAEKEALAKVDADAKAEKDRQAKIDAKEILALNIQLATSETAALKLQYEADMANKETSLAVKAKQEELYHQKLDQIRQKESESYRKFVADIARLDSILEDKRATMVAENSSAPDPTITNSFDKRRAAMASKHKTSMAAVTKEMQDWVDLNSKTQDEMRKAAEKSSIGGAAGVGASAIRAIQQLSGVKKKLDEALERQSQIYREGLTALQEKYNRLGLENMAETAKLEAELAKEISDARIAASKDSGAAQVAQLEENRDRLLAKLAEIHKTQQSADGSVVIVDPEFMRLSEELNQKTAEAIEKIWNESYMRSYDAKHAHEARMAELTETRMDDLELEYDRKKELAEVEIKDAEEKEEYLRMLAANRVRAVDEIQKQAADKERMRQEELIGATAGLMGSIAQLIATGDMKDKERRLAYKAAAKSEIAINTAIGVSKAYALGGPLGAITGAGVVIAGLAQERAVDAQKFAYGGIVEGPSSGDQVPVRANGGEMILTQQQQSRLFGMINGDSGVAGHTFTYAPTITGSANSSAMRQMLQENHAEFVRYVKQAVSDPSFARQQRAL